VANLPASIVQSVYNGMSAPSSTVSGSGGLTNAVKLAMSMVGGKYVLGAQNPSSKTFDCSGLTQWAFGQSGSNLPRLARQQYAATARVPMNSLQPGDLVFFKDPGASDITHVGIWIGNNQYVHAASESSGIKVSTAGGDYWNTSFVGGGRAVVGVNTPQTASAAQPKIAQSATTGSTWDSSTDSDVQAVQDQWRSAAATAQAQLDEQIRQFNQSIALEKDKFKQQQLVDERNYLIQQRDQYIQLGTTLLSTAASLSGPRDWLKYAQYTNGGQGLFTQLFGSTPAPAFGAATGYSEPNTVQNLLTQLGIGAGNVPQNSNLTQQDSLALGGLLNGAGQSATTSTTTPITTSTTTPTTTGSYTVKSGDTLTRLAAQYGTTVAELARINSISNPNLIRTGQKLIVPAAAQPPVQTTPVPTTATTETTQTAAPAGIPQPFQINPAVWDSLSPTAKQIVLGAWEGGLGTGGYVSGEDALASIEKARPKGQAVARPTMNWSTEQRW
jgi:LysM repeat protein